MNNVEEFYKARALLETVKNATTNRPMVYAYTENEQIVLKLNDDLREYLKEDKKRYIFTLMADVIAKSDSEVIKYVIEKLEGNVEYFKTKVIQDFKEKGA